MHGQEIDPKIAEMIMELMGELQDKMQYGEEDFSERLGRKKPEMEVVKLEGEIPGGDEGGFESDDSQEMEVEEEEIPESPEDKLKSRLMKLRG